MCVVTHKIDFRLFIESSCVIGFSFLCNYDKTGNISYASLKYRCVVTVAVIGVARVSGAVPSIYE